jgi:hypothetical protein
MHSVNFRILPPVKPVAFTYHFSLGNPHPSRYLVYLCIPSPDLAAQPDVSQQILSNHTRVSEMRSRPCTIAAPSSSPLNFFTKAPLTTRFLRAEFAG